MMHVGRQKELAPIRANNSRRLQADRSAPQALRLACAPIKLA